MKVMSKLLSLHLLTVLRVIYLWISPFIQHLVQNIKRNENDAQMSSLSWYHQSCTVLQKIKDFTYLSGVAHKKVICVERQANIITNDFWLKIIFFCSKILNTLVIVLSAKGKWRREDEIFLYFWFLQNCIVGIRRKREPAINNDICIQF